MVATMLPVRQAVTGASAPARAPAAKSERFVVAFAPVRGPSRKAFGDTRGESVKPTGECPSPYGTMTHEEARIIERSLVALDDLFYVFDVEGDPLVWNERAVEVTGYSGDEVDGLGPTDFVAEEHRERVAESVEEIWATGSSTVEADILTKGGERIPYEFNGQRLTDAEGTPIGLAGIGRDLTDRRERERELEEQAMRLRLFNLAFPDLAFVVGEDGRFLDVIAGESSESLLYEEPTAFLGESVHEIFPADLAEDLVSTTRRAIETDEPQRLEYALDFPDGERWFEARIESLPVQFEGTDATLWVARDVTARKEQEEELTRQNDRLERFASIVSHDLRNPLNVAQGRLDLLEEECNSEHVAPIETALERMERIIDDVLWLAREGRDLGTLDSVDLGDAVDVSWLVVADGAPDCELVVADGDGLGRIRADEDRLRQLLENLFRNAVEHGGDGVTVTVGRLEGGFYVADDGPGIPEARRDGVFDAGYSTSHEGTGFGLTIVREVADAHGWSLGVRESADGGARFEVTGVTAAE
jgi:PAS domain S-box-containing protein